MYMDGLEVKLCKSFGEFQEDEFEMENSQIFELLLFFLFE